MTICAALVTFLVLQISVRGVHVRSLVADDRMSSCDLGFGGLTPEDTCQRVMSFLRTLSDPERRDEKEKEMDVVPMVLDKGANHTSNGTENGTLEMTPVSSNAKIAPARAPAPAPAPAAVPASAPMSRNCTRIRDSIEKVDDIEQRCDHSSTCWPSLKRFIDHNRPIYQKNFEEHCQ